MRRERVQISVPIAALPRPCSIRRPVSPKLRKANSRLSALVQSNDDVINRYSWNLNTVA